MKFADKHFFRTRNEGNQLANVYNIEKRLSMKFVDKYFFLEIFTASFLSNPIGPKAKYFF